MNWRAACLRSLCYNVTTRKYVRPNVNKLFEQKTIGDTAGSVVVDSCDDDDAISEASKNKTLNRT
jgi:hypothetical protein